MNAKKALLAKCWCYFCWLRLNGNAPRFRMFFCAGCGNKRCPSATHHEHPCSGSNEPGQRGSRYGTSKLEVGEALTDDTFLVMCIYDQEPTCQL